MNWEINHQLCIFHLFRMIGKEVYKKLDSKFVSDRDKIRMCIVYTEIKEIFRTFDLNIAIDRLETLFKRIKEIPKVFHKLTRKIILDFERLTFFMRDGLVSRTTNPIESYYQNTVPESLKRVFKLPCGILNYLNTRREYWIGHFSKNI